MEWSGVYTQIHSTPVVLAWARVDPGSNPLYQLVLALVRVIDGRVMPHDHL